MICNVHFLERTSFSGVPAPYLVLFSDDGADDKNDLIVDVSPLLRQVIECDLYRRGVFTVWPDGWSWWRGGKS